MNRLFAFLVLLMASTMVVLGISSTNQLSTGVSASISNITVGLVRITPTGAFLNGVAYLTNATGSGGGGMTAGDTNWVLATIGGTNLLIRADLLAIINSTNNLLVGQIENARTNAIATNVTSSAGINSNAVNQIVSGTNDTTLAVVAGKAATNANLSAFNNDSLFVTKSVTNGLLVASDTNGYQRASVANTNNLTQSQADLLFIPLSTNLPTRIEFNSKADSNKTISVSQNNVTNSVTVGVGGNIPLANDVTKANSNNVLTVIFNGVTNQFIVGLAGQSISLSALTNGSPSSVILAAGSTGQIQYNNGGAFAGMVAGGVTNFTGMDYAVFGLPAALPSLISTIGTASTFLASCVTVSSNLQPFAMYKYGSAPIFQAVSVGGTVGAPTALANNANAFRLAGLAWHGSNDTTPNVLGRINWKTAEAQTVTNGGGHLTFETHALGTAASAEKVRLTSEGVLLVGLTTTNTSGGALLRVAGAIESTALNSSGAAWVNPNGTYSQAVGYKTNTTLAASVGAISFWGAIFYMPFNVTGATGNWITNIAYGTSVRYTFTTNQVTAWGYAASNDTATISHNIW